MSYMKVILVFVYEGKCSYKDVSANVLFDIIAVQGFSPF